MNKLTVRFLLHTFGILAISWGVCMVYSLCGIYMREHPLLYVLYFIGGFSPTIASFIVQKADGKIQNFKEWRAIVFDFKHPIASYLLIPILAGLFFLCLCTVSGYEAGAPIFAVVFMIPMMLFGGGLEEAGWRGVLQPELEKQFGFTAATLMVAVIWWIWHLPLFYIVGVSQYGADFLAFGINVLGLSFALATVRKITGSTWLCVLLHCLINSLHGVFLINENISGNLTAAAAVILVSYVLLWVNKRKSHK